MEAGIRYGKTAWVEPAVVFLFFFNTFLLPQGISFTLLLMPAWIYLLHLDGRLRCLRHLLLPVLLYGAIHTWLGVNLLYYAISLTMLLCIVTFCIWIWPHINDPAIDYAYLINRLMLVNFVLTLISLPLLLVPPLKSLAWYSMSMSDGIKVFPRLKLFTYEASHYSYLITPLVIYFYSLALFSKVGKTVPALLMVTIPLLLSLSFGVMACLVLSGAILIAANFNSIFDTRKKRLHLLLGILGVAIACVLLYLFFPDNILYVRIHNMLTGKDTSGRGRTYESFILAHKIAAEKSLWWGIGIGQIKELGRNIIVQYYSYSKIPDTIRIPNACAETIACFGYVGFILRIGIQIVLFRLTRVSTSHYRLWLFLFLFIFQFTGSYITNVTEYVFWMIAFSPFLAPPSEKVRTDSTRYFTPSA